MPKNIETREIIKLYLKDGLTMEAIGRQYGVIKQAIQQRLARAGVQRRPKKHEAIARRRLEKLYLTDRFPIDKIAALLGTDSGVIRQALDFHKIPKRKPLKFGGKLVDFLRTLETGESREITLDQKCPQSALHRSTVAAGMKIKTRSLGDNKLAVTRIK